MNHAPYSDDYLRGIFARVKTIAMVGASPRPDRPSHGVMRFLQQRGFGEHRADGELVFARERGRSQRGREHLDGVGPAAALERGSGARQERLERGGRHGRSIA